MDDFKIDSENRNNAMINLLVETLAHHWAFTEFFLTELAQKESRDIAELKKKYEEWHRGYQKLIWSRLKEDFGHFDFNDLVK